MKPEKLTVTLQDTEADRYQRMFNGACMALGAVGDALGCDPDEGGAEPLLFAIAKLKERLDAYMQRSVELAGMYNTLLQSESTDEKVRQIALHRDHIIKVNDKFRDELHSIKSQPVAAYRMESRPGDYNFMEAKHWEYNKDMYQGCRVHELHLGKMINSPGIDEEVALTFPGILEERLKENRPDLYAGSSGLCR